MPKESGKSGKNHSLTPKFGDESETDIEPSITINDIEKHSTGAVSINLRYYYNKCECFSQWQSAELKKFSGTIEKIRGYTFDTLRVNKTLCEIHRGPPKASRFSRPESISDDIQFYEIKVDPSKKLRIHGFFIKDIFF